MNNFGDLFFSVSCIFSQLLTDTNCLLSDLVLVFVFPVLVLVTV